MSEVLTLETNADEIAEWAATADFGEGILTVFGEIDPKPLSVSGKLSALQAYERLRAWVDAGQARILADLVEAPHPLPVKPSPQRSVEAAEFIRDEITLALKWTFDATDKRVRVAKVLVHRLPATLALLSKGKITYLHAQALALAVEDLDVTIAAKIEERVVARAPQQPVADFRGCVRRAVARLDPRDPAERHRKAAEDRGVGQRPAESAMAFITAFLPAEDAAAVMTAIQAVADGFPRDGRTPDQRRADALVAICQAVLNGTVIENLPKWQGRNPSVQVVVALSTLLGLDDQPGDLTGYGPIPADTALRMAADPTATWRRLVTDPLGRPVDYGRTTYRPPQDLRDFIIARDQTSRFPGDNTDARRSEIDHRQEWARGGETNAENLDAQSRRPHHLKHDAGWTTNRNDDGSFTWTTPTDREYDKQPPEFPEDTTRPKITPEDNPPF